MESFPMRKCLRNGEKMEKSKAMNEAKNRLKERADCVAYGREVLRCLLKIGMAVQILMGFIWIGGNFISLIKDGGFLTEDLLKTVLEGNGEMRKTWDGYYGESDLYLKAAVDFMMDEFTGPLYPVLLTGLKGMAGGFNKAFELLLYFFQCVVSFLCCLCFIRRWMFGGRKKEELLKKEILFYGSFLFTIPFLLQWYLAILPISLFASGYLLLLEICRNEVCKMESSPQKGGSALNLSKPNGLPGQVVKDLLRSLLLWLLLTLLMPDAWWFCLLPVLYLAGKCIKIFDVPKKKACCIGLAALLAAAALAGPGLNRLVQTPGSSERMQRSLGAAMVSRMVWPNFGKNFFFWPQEIKELMTEEEAASMTWHADDVQRKFGPLVEEAYGRKEADRLYFQMAFSCLKVRTKEVLSAIGEDFAAYLLAPFAIPVQLNGTGLSLSGWNYGKMRCRMPHFTGLLIGYDAVAVRIGMLLILVIFFLQRKAAHKGAQGTPQGVPRKKQERNVLFLSCMLFQAVWYTFSGAGMMDYGNVPFVIQFWYILLLLPMKPQSPKASRGA